MRYKLDASGYIFAVSFGCYLDDCMEYTGEIPAGYKSLDDWATNACIQAYYIDLKGNLVADHERRIELENKQEQEAIDNSPVLRKDIYETDEALEGQYIREVATGKVIVLKDIKTIAPKVKITGIPKDCKKLSIYTQGKNMLPCNAESCVISGVTFTKNASGSITILGTATKNIDYVIADGKDTPIFALKAKLNYYLNLGGLRCEFKYFNGETTAQQYIGASGLLNLPKHIEVTQVIIKIASGDSINKTFYPQLEYGKAFTSYESHKLKALEIDVGEFASEMVLPSDTLYADDDLYPGTFPKVIDYIQIGDGKINVSIDNVVKLFKSGSVGLFSKYNTIYATKDVNLEVEYSANFLLVDSLAFLQGKATTTNKFKILEDGSIQAHNGYFSGRIEADSGYFKGTVEWEKIKDENGNEVDEIVTQITRDTVTTKFVNALGVKAGSVDAENITGTTITGKTLMSSEIYSGKISGTTISGGTISGTTIKGGSVTGTTISGGTVTGTTIKGGSIEVGSYFSVDSYGKVVANSLTSNNVTITGGSIKVGSKFSVDTSGNVIANSLESNDATITGGEIGGLTIDKKSIRSGKTSLTDSSTGIYIGTDGISLGKDFKVTSSGDITIGVLGDISIGGTITVGTSYSYRTKIEENKITFGNSSTAPRICVGSELLMTFTTSTVSMQNSAIIGGSNGRVGFFAQAGSTKKTVSTITATSPTASTVASKVNELINALKAYNLIA